MDSVVDSEAPPAAVSPDVVIDPELLAAATPLDHCALEFPNKSAVARTLARKFSEISSIDTLYYCFATFAENIDYMTSPKCNL